MVKNYDFWGWATRNDLKCSDGRTIRHDAFKDCDGKTVPLVWNHQHNDPDNILGHALLKNTDEGVKAYGFFNDAPKSQNVKSYLQHGDITSLSIYANGLKQTRNGDVLHGIIREVSLVLAGANPGASIEYVMAHSADEDPIAIGAEIYSGEELIIHANNPNGIEIVDEPEEAKETESTEELKDDNNTEVEEKKETETENTPVAEEKESEEIKHSDSENEKTEDKEMPKEEKDKTVQEVLDSMTEEQRKVTEYLVGEALNASQDDENDEEGEEVKHNAFDNEEVVTDKMSEEIFSALKDAKRNGTVRESMIAHGLNPEEVLVHGVEHVDYMFPDAQLATGRTIPVVNTNPNGWVSIVMNGVHKTPFSKVKSILADLRADDARARGYYTKGTLKKEEVIKLLKREVTPTTIYKKQTIDRDDIVDLEEGNIDFIAMIKDEMKVKWDEEAARAILFGDGRTLGTDEDKIDETKIIPVVTDTVGNLYAMVSEVTPETNQPEGDAIIDAVVRGLDQYEGSGNLIAFIRSDKVSDMLLMKDKFGHRLYKNMDELTTAMTVERVVKVPAGIVPEGFYGVVLDLADYNIGSNKAGERSLFDDFDIDYNKMKYLLEGRRSGALIKPHSAVVLKAHTESNSQESSLDDGE